MTEPTFPPGWRIIEMRRVDDGYQIIATAQTTDNWGSISVKEPTFSMAMDMAVFLATAIWRQHEAAQDAERAQAEQDANDALIEF